MATLKKADGTSNLFFGNVLSANATLSSLPNGAGTLVGLARSSPTENVGFDFFGLTSGTGSSAADWYHFLNTNITGGATLIADSDDDGIVGCTESTWTYTSTHWYIFSASWPGTGAALERFGHWDLDAGGAWGFGNSSANNGGLRAGPGTGFLRVGCSGDRSGGAEYALVAVWAGTQLSDAQVQELSVNKKTSDWWNCSAGRPTALVELNTATPVDIGNVPSTFNSIGTLTLTGSDPSGWTFDGRGSPGISRLHGLPYERGQEAPFLRRPWIRD